MASKVILSAMYKIDCEDQLVICNFLKNLLVE